MPVARIDRHAVFVIDCEEDRTLGARGMLREAERGG
jgi:hypothetical protein